MLAARSQAMSGRVKWHQRLHFNGNSIATGHAAWDASAGKGLAAGTCTEDTAARLIPELNGRDRTDVFLGWRGDEGVDQHLAVAGGNAGRYLVVAQEPGRYFYLARRPAPARPEELVEVMVGGLPAFYPRAVVPSLAAALTAVEHYFRTGRKARKLSWMQGEVAERLRRHAEDVRWRLRTSGNGG
jgi:hypothetical protein